MEITQKAKSWFMLYRHVQIEAQILKILKHCQRNEDAQMCT